MVGEIGVIKRGDKQVGGFINWQISYNNNVGKTLANAQGFWILGEISSGEFFAQFYKSISNRLEMVNEATVKADFPDCVQDKLIRHPMTMEFLQ